jgi:hypothetical protein
MDSIISYDPDVIALSEFRTKPGAPLCAKLAATGWRYIESTNPTGHDNGLCVKSRTPIVRARPCPAPPENCARWLDVPSTHQNFRRSARIELRFTAWQSGLQLQTLHSWNPLMKSGSPFRTSQLKLPGIPTSPGALSSKHPIGYMTLNSKRLAHRSLSASAIWISRDTKWHGKGVRLERSSMDTQRA